MNEIIKRMNEIKARRLEIRGGLEKRDASVDLDKLATELTDLETEYNGLEQRKRLLEGIADGSVPTNPVANPVANPAPANDQRAGQVSDLEERSAFIREITGATVENVEENARRFAQTEGAKTVIKVGAVKRSLTIASGGIAKPTKVSEIQPGENTVSGLLDMVLVVEAEGMAKDSVPYEKTGSTAEVGTDGTAPTATDPTYGVAEITPVLVNTLSYVSKHIKNLTPLNYQERVAKSALTALRTKVGKMIVTGNPKATKAEICGIINADAIATSSDLEISAIDATTLRKIALGYGGDENLVGDCVLVLNKKDLIAFGDVRGTNEKKAVYEISYDKGSSTTGIIKDGGLAVRFVINSACDALANATAGGYTMAYGKNLTYQLDLFSGYTVEVSKDYKFAEGLLAVLGEVMVGGNVIAHNGWTRVKKKAAS